jgi:hypothetical protein
MLTKIIVGILVWMVIFFGGRELFFDRPDSPPPERGTGEIVKD